MKKLLLIIAFFCINIIVAQLPNDCIDNIITCGSNDLNLDVDGVGIPEVTANTCGGGEHNSVWLQVTPTTSGTLGFFLRPIEPNIEIDFDFFVFGPDVPCGNLGDAIRCSTTNPNAANQGNNVTGMRDTNDDETSEGPGSDGDSFVEWLNVNAGETYYIMIDKPPVSDAFSGAFSLEWTGTATFSSSPTNDLPSGVDLIFEECDDDGNGIVTFNLTLNEASLIGTQDVNTSYFESLSDAQLKINPIDATDTISYNSSTATIYVRLTDNTTGCFSIFDIELIVHAFQINAPNTLYECESSGIANFDFLNQSTLLLGNNLDTVISYYLSETNAQASSGNIGNSYTNSSIPETIWYRLDNLVTGCFYIGSFDIIVLLDFFVIPEPSFILDETFIYCEDTYPETIPLEIIFDNNDINDFSFLWSTGETTSSIAINLAGNYSVEITNPQNCDSKTKTFHILGSRVFNSAEPNFLDEEIYYCIDTFPNTIPLDVGIENNNLSSYTYLWSTNETSPIININEVGNYTVEVFNSDLCSVTRTITVLPSEAPTFENVLVTENEFYKKVSIIIVISGQGNYEYGIDIDPLDIDNDENYQDENYFENVEYGTHIIYVRDKNGCGELQKEILLLEYPKFITPNNDGVYDTWNINNINAINNNFNTISNITIFDRYGKIIANINPNGLGWDGNYLGNPAPPSDYWFRLELIDFSGKSITKNGHFALKRIK